MLARHMHQLTIPCITWQLALPQRTTKEDKTHGHANAHVFSPTNPELFYSQPFPAVASDWGDHD